MNRLDELFEGLPTVLDVHAVAEVLGTSQKGVYRWINTGVIPAYKIGGQWHIVRDELKDTMARGSNLAAGHVEAQTGDGEPDSPDS